MQRRQRLGHRVVFKVNAEQAVADDVWCLQELYGNAVAGRLISAFSRLFTHYLQAGPQLPSYSHVFQENAWAATLHSMCTGHVNMSTCRWQCHSAMWQFTLQACMSRAQSSAGAVLLALS